MIGIRECRTLGFRHRGRRCRAQLLCSVQSSASRAEGAMRTRLTHESEVSLIPHLGRRWCVFAKLYFRVVRPTGKATNNQSTIASPYRCIPARG